MILIDGKFGGADSMTEVNGTTVYKGGQPGTALLCGAYTVRVACIGCKYLVSDDDYTCTKLVDDEGRYYTLEDESRKTTRCTEWHPHPRFAMLGKNQGKVDSPQFAKWKTENIALLKSPSAFGYDHKTEDLRDWLERKFAEQHKNTPTTLCKDSSKK